MHIKKLSFLGAIVAGLLFTAGATQAATLSVSGGTALSLPADFTSSAAGGLIGPGTNVTLVNTANPGSLVLSGLSQVSVQYLGSEAGHINTFSLSSALFSTNTSVPGAPATVLGPLASIPFVFDDTTAGISATNGSAIPAGVSIAFAALGDGSFLALFDDAGTNHDWDDMVVRISPVPLPAAAWLLISAVLGLVSFSRIRRSNTQSA